jgi:hypothetical protein
LSLPDKAIEEMNEADLDTYVVVRVADEIVVDLMKAACGIEYREAARSIDLVEIKGGGDPVREARVALSLKRAE